MKTAFHRLLCALALVTLSWATLGCAAQKAATLPPDEASQASRTPAPPPQPARSAEPAAATDDLPAPTLYYALDSSQLTPEGQERLKALATALRARRDVAVTISGHTCELGTSEYNLALGQQRANRAREYLVALGVEPSRISTVSFGEEQPADDGQSESARARNRRSEVRPTGAPVRASQD